MLIQVKNHQVASLDFLRRLVLVSIFEPESLGTADQALMESSIVSWSKKIGITDDEKKRLEWCGWMLAQNEKGKLNRQKEIYREHKIDWRKAYRTPKVPRAWLN